MKIAPLLLFFIAAWASAQDRVAVAFKVFPPNYEVFVQGDRLDYSTRTDGLRVYALPTGAVRVNLTAPHSAPQGLALTVTAGMPAVQAKLESRQGPLTLSAEAPTGKGPRSVAFSADGKSLYVALQGEPGVDVYSLPLLKKIGHLTPPDPAVGVSDVIAAGSEIWAAGLDGRVLVYDAATLNYKDSAPLTGGGNAFFTDLGGRYAVVNWDSGQLQAIDGKHQPTASLTFGGAVRGFSWFKDTGYVSLFDKGQVAVVDQTWKVKTVWKAGEAPRPVAAAGGRLFVGDMANASVLVLDAATGKLQSTVAVASNPHRMAVSKDGTLVAVASRGKNNPNDYQLPGPEFGKVTVFFASGAVAGSVWGRNQPTGVAFSPDGKHLAFTDFLDDDVELYRLTLPAPARR